MHIISIYKTNEPRADIGNNSVEGFNRKVTIIIISVAIVKAKLPTVNN